MACNFSNGTCGGCDNFVKTTAISLVGTTIVLTIPTQTLNNGQQFCICLSQSLPTYTGIPNVAVKVGATTYPIIDTVTMCNCGTPNNLYVDQLIKKCDGTVRPRQIISVKFGTDTKLFNYVGGRKPLCKSAATFTTITSTSSTIDEIKVK